MTHLVAAVRERADDEQPVEQVERDAVRREHVVGAAKRIRIRTERVESIISEELTMNCVQQYCRVYIGVRYYLWLSLNTAMKN